MTDVSTGQTSSANNQNLADSSQLPVGAASPPVDDQNFFQVSDQGLATQPVATAVTGTTGISKEREGISTPEPEQVGVVELKEPEEVPPEVAGWVERVKRDDIHLPEPVTHDGQIIVAPSQPKQVKIVLPLSQTGVQQGLTLKVVYSLRWLAEWCMRIIKKLPGKVMYRSAERPGMTQ